ncbi:MAG: hypothetical protein DI551_01940 [Micavibrio aeruginosavorus]|uniref:Pili assembly chaperone N-terminal domain-containing protein n=1 Tax=Micavibrio aeruginosavorus TaxID=349221 RepID=A0A2W5Q0H8_9BACT|nr:MAG: hypothetical protein DI551_01940 [Micavibrio aeruginosavorus]
MCSLFLLVFGLLPQKAHAELTITPNVVLIQGRDRFAEVNLINTGDSATTYQIGWRFFKMTETGYQPVEASLTPFDLSQNVVFTPRTVTLEPGVRQKVRLALRLKSEPPAPGDYRAHLSFKMVSDPLASLKAKKNAPGEHKNIVGVGMKVGYSIPIIYRVGESNSVVTIDKAAFQINPKNKKPEATVTFSRGEGAYGVVGHLYLYHKPASGEEKLVGEISNANIFSELKSRTLTIPLNVETLSGGALHVVYMKTESKNQKDIIAERSFPIGQ